MTEFLRYASLVRPHLEYAVPVWNPSLKNDIDKQENVQHRTTRLEKGKSRGRVKKALKLATLEFYKILNGLESIE